MSGGRAIGRPTNALDEAEVDEVVAWAAKQYGTIDILVNAVGGSTIIEKPGATVDELTFDEWQKLIAFNLNGTFLFCHAVTPLMKRRKHGKIVNLASIAGRGLSVAVQRRVCRCEGRHHRVHPKLAFELGPFGINVNAIAPSRTLTERIRPRWNQQSPEDQAAEIERSAAASHGRSGGPGEGDLLPRFV